MGSVAIGGAIALALLAVAGVGLYLGWEWIASHERVLVGVTVIAVILLGSMVANWIGKKTGLDGGGIFSNDLQMVIGRGRPIALPFLSPNHRTMGMVLHKGFEPHPKAKKANRNSFR